MTSNLKIVTCNFPVRIETYDNGTKTDSKIVLPGDDLGPQVYITTTREIRFIDLASDDPAVIEEKKARIAVFQAQIDAATPKPAPDAPVSKAGTEG